MGDFPIPSIEGFTSFEFVRDRTNFTVWRARRIVDDALFDIHVAHKDGDSSVIDRGLAVYRYVCGVNAPGTIRVIKVEHSPKCSYIVTEHLSLPSLFDYVKKNGPFDSRKAFDIASQIGKTLSKLNEAHSFAVRNIKPESIVIDQDGMVKICDFGIAIFPGDAKYSTLADDGNIVGTPQFISPEQAQASSKINERTDQYSLGALLYFLTTGVIPFDGTDPIKILSSQIGETLPDPRQLQSSISKSLSKFICFLMMKDAVNRYATFDDMVFDCENAVRDKALTLEVPVKSLSTIQLVTEKKESAVVNAPKMAMPSEGVGNNRLRELAGKDVKMESSGVLFGHFVLWIVLIGWFFYFTSLRIGNPLNLPGPRPIPRWLYAGGSEGKRDALTPTPPSRTIGTDIDERPMAKSDAGIDRTKPTPRSVAVSKNFGNTDSDAANDFKAAAEKVEPELESWNGPVIEKMKELDFAGAARLATESKSTIGEKAAPIFARVPNLNALVTSEIMKKEGRSVTLTFMGKERDLVPISANGTVISTSFNGRTVNVDVATLAEEEKLRWLDDVEGEAAHTLGLALALKLANDDAVSLHKPYSGAVGKILK